MEYEQGHIIVLGDIDGDIKFLGKGNSIVDEIKNTLVFVDENLALEGARNFFVVNPTTYNKKQITICKLSNIVIPQFTLYSSDPETIKIMALAKLTEQEIELLGITKIGEIDV